MSSNINKLVLSILEDDDLKKYDVLFTPRRISDRTERELIRILNVLKKEECNGDLDFSVIVDAGLANSITSLGNLRVVHGNVILTRSKITSLGKLERIDGDLVIYDSQIRDLGNLEYIGRNFKADESKLTSFGKLKFIGSSISVEDTPMKTLGNNFKEFGYNFVKDKRLKYDSFSLMISRSDISSLGSVERIKGDFYAERTKLVDLYPLREVDGLVDLDYCQELTTLEPLEVVKGNLSLRGTPNLTDISSLRLVKGEIFISDDSKVDRDKLSELRSLRSKVSRRYTDQGNKLDIGYKFFEY